MRRIGMLLRFPVILVAALLLVAGVALPSVGAQEKGMFKNESYTGLYDEGGRFDDDWYYDAYSAPGLYPYWYGGYGWYGYYPYYSGLYGGVWGTGGWYYDYYDYYDYDNDWWDWNIGF